MRHPISTCPPELIGFSPNSLTVKMGTPCSPNARKAETMASDVTRIYIDCEFDGHNGPLLSIALVEQDGRSVHIEADVRATDAWVLANVVPLMDCHEATDCARVAPGEIGGLIRWFIGGVSPIIIADSPVDIARFCQAISTDINGEWASNDHSHMTFEVHNVDCYPTDLPGAVQHNAWWDAMALRHRIAHSTQPPPIEAGLAESVARAMCADGGFDPNEIMANDGPRWKYYESGATAAITALSAHRAEPTEAMERQGVAEALAYGFDGFEPKHVRAIYQAMTKEAG
jgi:hypothetical protein